MNITIEEPKPKKKLDDLAYGDWFTVSGTLFMKVSSSNGNSVCIDGTTTTVYHTFSNDVNIKAVKQVTVELE